MLLVFIWMLTEMPIDVGYSLPNRFKHEGVSR